MTGASLVDAGGRFMTGAEMAAEAERFGLPPTGLYFRGRVGALGEVAAPVATALLGIFPARVVELTWERSAALPAAVATEAYGRACARWGRTHLAGLDRLGPLADRVVDAAEPSALALFAGWRARPRPEDPAGRAAYGLMLLRELRGGLHFAALRAQDVDVPLAVVTDPRGGEARLRRPVTPREQPGPSPR